MGIAEEKMSLKRFRVYFKAQIEVEAKSKKTARKLVKDLLKMREIKKLEFRQVRKA